ncbi:MAG: carbohydrate ABC transporter permease, partial [Alphaproteobacteria bacterium]
MTAQAIATPLTDASDRLNRPLLRPAKVLMWSILMVGGLLMVLPFIFMVSTSFKFNNEIYELSLLPKRPTISNYQFL